MGDPNILSRRIVEGLLIEHHRYSDETRAAIPSLPETFWAVQPTNGVFRIGTGPNLRAAFRKLRERMAA